MKVPANGSTELSVLPILLLAAALGAGCGRGGEGEPGGESAKTSPALEGTYLNVVAPSIIVRGAESHVRLRPVTKLGAPDYDFEGAFRIEAEAKVEFPDQPALEPDEDGFFEMAGLRFLDKGVQKLRALVPNDTIQALANPVNVVEHDPDYHIYWGELNGHSDLSSGEFAPAVYFWYAKAVALLDFAALTDNDRLEDRDKMLDEESFFDAYQVAEEAQRAGQFVTLGAFEWTSRTYGNRLVFFSEKPSVLPSVANGYDTPAKLRAALPKGSVMAIPHPSGSEESYPTDPGSVGAGGEQLVEVYSSVGVFEVPGSERASTHETPGASVTDLLRRGFQAGFIGTGDSYLTTPGNPRPVAFKDHPYRGGLTAVLATKLTREAILEALRAGRCYATTGPRYLLEFTVDEQPMGSRVRVPRGHVASVYGSLGSTANWVRAEIVGSQGVLKSLIPPQGEEAEVVTMTAETQPVEEPTWVYLRGVDEQGGRVWSSPVYLIPE